MKGIILSFLRLLVRPWWLRLFLPRMIAPALLAVGRQIPLNTLFQLVSLTVIGCATIAALDDYFDREQDRQENPSRPIPSGHVSPSQAIVAAALMAALGSYVALRIGLTTFLLAGLIGVLFTLSATVLRATLLTVISLPLTSSIVLALSYTAVSEPDGTLLLLMLVFLVWDLGHDTTETLADPWSAVRMDRGTIPFLLGRERAFLVILGSVAITLLLSVLLGIVARLQALYWLAVALGSIPYVSSVIQLQRKFSADQARRTFLWITRFQTAQLVGIGLDRLLLG